MFQRAARSYSALSKHLHTESWEEHSLTRWLTAKEKHLQLRNVIPTATQLKDVFRILPTRTPNDFDTHKKLLQNPPERGDAIDVGYHLVVPALYPNSRSRPDGSPAIHAPPPPWTRKLWTGGKMHFAPQPLLMGLGYVQKRISLIRKSAHGGRSMRDTMDFEEQEYDPDYEPEYVYQELLPSVKMLHRFSTMQWFPQKLNLILEERETEFYTERYDHSHVKTSTLIPPQSGSFCFAFNATRSIISTFCAASLETHRIHSDLIYAREEGYPDLVIPIQLQLILILDIVGTELAEGISVLEIEYQVLNPLFAEREISIYKHWIKGPQKRDTIAWQLRSRSPSKSQRENMQKYQLLLWTTDEEGVVGIVAKIFLRPPLPKSSRRLKPWGVSTHDQYLVYAKRSGLRATVASDHHSLEEGDRRVTENTSSHEASR